VISDNPRMSMEISRTLAETIRGARMDDMRRDRQHA
jgi:hypothetical protein